MKNLKKLLSKYSEPVPRYTSYPPATHFREGISNEEYIKYIEESNFGTPQNISTYIHIPFCSKMCHYCGCNMLLLKKKDNVCNYVEAVISEIDMVSEHIDRNRKLSQIHFGGGTPNAIETSYLRKIVENIRSKFSEIENPEIAIECNPAYISFEYLDDLLDIGFNRISFGIQDFDEEVLKNSNREPPLIPIEELFDYLRNKNSDISINLDFIYGLPGQTVESFMKSMKKAVEIKPDRLVTFSYAHVPWVNTKQKYLEKLGLPDPFEKIEMFETSFEFLESKGYLPIGMDHYVAQGDELYEAAINSDLHRNFQGYCTRRTTGQVYAFGMSSISQYDKSYIQNVKTTDEYIKMLSNGNFPIKKFYSLSDEERIIREVINYLMCNKAINWEIITENVNRVLNSENFTNTEQIKSILKYKKENLDVFVNDNLIKFNEDNFEVLGTSVLYIRNIAAAIDPNFESKEGKYSKSV
ncbi:MAG: oxygen-independent coproporphyrinogen III oxidase [Candidatus Kapabacteria bacterium]|nr:oxygen-independent coproporphyrinogen III oxidase [Ignavibacteriota bacterium]MCW5885500.1 oxygen-independent coproporphyrinogen III oxidase [Candidatus Kapabacteria bacterium]